MDKVFTVYVSPLELGSTEDELVDMPMNQEGLDKLLQKMGTGRSSPCIRKCRITAAGSTLRSTCRKTWS